MPPTDMIKITRPASVTVRPSTLNTNIVINGHINDPPAELIKLATRNTFTSRG
ncbi:hypothetical protein D3C76_1849340 [compost metagenome]